MPVTSARIPLLLAITVSINVSTARSQTTYDITHRYRQAKSVLAVGDWNGDTHPDFLVGDPDGNVAELVSGHSFTPIKTWSGPTPGSEFGTRLAARDVNSDGIPDFVVTAPKDQAGKGAFYLIDGKTLAIVGQGVGDGGDFGWSVCFADVYPFTPDGVPEVVVGAPSWSSASKNQTGEVRIFEVKNFVVKHVGASNGTRSLDRYGEDVASNGDLDGRPGDEIVISAKGHYTSIGGCSGGYFVIKSNITAAHIPGPLNVCFGSSILIDDVDEDNEKELVFGSGFNNRTAQVDVYDFDTTTSAWKRTRTFTPNPPILNFGIDIVRVPDINNDGVRDLAIAGTDDVQLWSGRSFLPLGGFSLNVNNGGIRPQLGYLGDVDQDGVFDLACTAPWDNYPNWLSSLQIHSPKKWSFTPADNYVNATRGGTVTMNIDVGPAFGGQFFMILGSLSGLGPPKQFGNATGKFTLVPDVFTALLPNLVNHGPFVNWIGFLDGSGKASPQPRWSSGNVAAYAPLSMHLQALVIDLTKLEFSHLTNARHFMIR
ncbi:MAG: VCBS repeat-containing protein [Planctomycetes bacterium]|nr:VCBS repeat-containing protein [Planctomycetota bacterium]